MSVKPHPEAGGPPPRGDHAPDQGQQLSADDHERLRQVHADPDQLNQESREQDSRRAQGVNDPSHASGRPEDHAHGRHGKGFSDESMVDDEQATDTGDDRQLRTAGGGGDKAPDPDKFRENSAGRMGGAGWGSEQVGGSTVDRRPDGGRNA